MSKNSTKIHDIELHFPHQLSCISEMSEKNAICKTNRICFKRRLLVLRTSSALFFQPEVNFIKENSSGSPPIRRKSSLFHLYDSDFFRITVMKYDHTGYGS